MRNPFRRRRDDREIREAASRLGWKAITTPGSDHYLKGDRTLEVRWKRGGRLDEAFAFIKARVHDRNDLVWVYDGHLRFTVASVMSALEAGASRRHRFTSWRVHRSRGT